MRTHALRKYASLFGAVFKKNLLEYVRYPANFLFSLFVPVVWTLPIYFLIRSFAPDGTSAGLMSWVGSSDFFGYFIIGMIVGNIIMSIFWGMDMVILTKTKWTILKLFALYKTMPIYLEVN